MKKIFFFTIGLLCVGLGGLGVVLPGLPTTPFLIAATACFAKSSTRMHYWLLHNKIFGPFIKNWFENKTIPRRAKQFSLASVVLVGGWSLYTLPEWYLKLSLCLILIFPLVYLSRMKVSD